MRDLVLTGSKIELITALRYFTAVPSGTFLTERLLTRMTDRKWLNVDSREIRESLVALIPNIRAFAISLCGDHEHADDLVQETLLEAWGHLESFQPGTNLRAWLIAILRNHYLSECRLMRYRGDDLHGHKFEALCVPADQDGSLDMQDFRKALNLLLPEQRQALILVGAAAFSTKKQQHVNPRLWSPAGTQNAPTPAGGG